MVEAFNASQAGGTGIATYIRNLTHAAQANGYQVDGLLHTFAKLDKKDEILSEIGFHDARNLHPSWFATNVEGNWRRFIGKPRGFATRQIRHSGFIVDSGAASVGAVAMFGTAHVARMFMDFSRFHFMRYGTAARVNVPKDFSLFHATQLVPLRVPGAANIYTIHDIVPLLLPYTTLDDKKFFLSLVRHLCRTADHIVTVSESAKADIMSLTGIPESRITNTYQAVAIPPAYLAESEFSVAATIENLFGLEYKQYFLFYGALEPKKNVSRLLSAYAASGSKYPLIMAGPLGWNYDSELRQIEQQEFQSWKISGDRITSQRRVRRLEYVPFAQLVPLIRGARALLFPSLYEGFGLPVLEAMTLGTPVMTSNSGALAEISGEAALLVDPLSIESITAAIQTLDADNDLREELAARGRKQAEKFSEKTYRNRIGELYRSVIG
jgi:glycosyltransferase involved in cell wall biosynthesis